MAQLNFDATNIVPNTGTPDPIPSDWYNASIDESELKPTKAGDGAYLKLRFTVLDGQYANRKVYTNLNVRNSNPVAQEIAYADLSAIAHATGVIQVADSQQLHGIPIKIKVKLKPAKDGYDANNEISAYKNINDPSATSGMAPAQQAPQGFAQQAPQGFAQPPVAPAAAQAPTAQQPWAQPPVAPAAAQAPTAPAAVAGMPPWAQGQ